MWTVFGTFFLAELGDKTQLTVLTLSAEGDPGWSNLLWIGIGASLALLLADLIGLLVGYVLGKTLPSQLFSWISFSIFAVFGIVKLLGGLETVFQDRQDGKLSAIVGTIVITILFAGFTLHKVVKKQDGEKAYETAKNAENR